MILEIKVHDDYQKEFLSIVENLKGIMIETVSKKETEDDLDFLTGEIEEGLRSGKSKTTHSELFKRLKTKYA